MTSFIKAKLMKINGKTNIDKYWAFCLYKITNKYLPTYIPLDLHFSIGHCIKQAVLSFVGHIHKEIHLFLYGHIIFFLSIQKSYFMISRQFVRPVQCLYLIILFIWKKFSIKQLLFFCRYWPRCNQSTGAWLWEGNTYLF